MNDRSCCAAKAPHARSATSRGFQYESEIKPSDLVALVDGWHGAMVYGNCSHEYIAGCSSDMLLLEYTAAASLLV